MDLDPPSGLKSSGHPDENRLDPKSQPDRAMKTCNTLHSTRPSERGMVIIYVAILSLVLLGLAGIAVDSALVLSAGQQLQSAADGAALNAVRYIDTESDPCPTTRAAAMSVALANEAVNTSIKLDPNPGNASTGDIVVGYWNHSTRTFTPTTLSPNAVRVHASRTAGNADGPLGLLFGPIFGKDSSDVGASSTAVMALPLEPLVLILDPTGNNALNVNGTNYLEVINGAIQVNSSGGCALHLVGTPVMTADLIKVVGGGCYPEGTITGTLQEGADVVADPLADILPTTTDWNAFKASLPKPMGASGKIAAGGTYEPGYYPRGLDIQASDKVTLKPGNYMFGDDVKLVGGSHLYGSGVTLFFDKDVHVDVSGDEAGMELTPADSGPFEGITFFMHRESDGPVVCKIGGGGIFKVEGIIYIPSGELVLGGTPGKEIGAILVYSCKTDGVTGYTITGKGVPKLTDDIPAMYLVE